MGGGYIYLYSNGLALVTLVWTHVLLNIDTDGYIWKYL